MTNDEQEYEEFFVNGIETIAGQREEIRRLRTALEEIANCDGMTLIGCDPEHEYTPGVYPAEERAHQYGAYKAFNQCAAIAQRALKGSGDDNG